MVNRKRKFNFMDLLIILIIVLGVAFGFKKFKKADMSSPVASKNAKILVSYYIEEVPSFAADAIEIGSPVREEVQNSYFGNVIKKDVGESVSWARNNKGEFFKSSRDGYNSLEITMEADGVIGENGVTIDKSVYYIGQTVTLKAGNSLLKTGRISDVKLAE